MTVGITSDLKLIWHELQQQLTHAVSEHSSHSLADRFLDTHLCSLLPLRIRTRHLCTLGKVWKLCCPFFSESMHYIILSLRTVIYIQCRRTTKNTILKLYMVSCKCNSDYSVTIHNTIRINVFFNKRWSWIIVDYFHFIEAPLTWHISNRQNRKVCNAILVFG